MATESLESLRTGVYREFYEGLLPFWRTQVLDYQHGGFIGRMSNDLTIDRRAPKGLILNTRLLWTYSALFRYTEDDSFLTLARRAYEHLNTHFLDEKFGGAFWFIDAQGTVLDGKKKTYGHAFFIYALVEYVLATQDKAAEKLAIDLFNIVEQHTYDSEFKGYLETFERNWSEAEDARLSSIDMNEKKSMNTHLHVLEAYTHLYRIWKNKTLELKLNELIHVFLDYIVDPTTFHFKLFFDPPWNSKSDRISFGHDIEGSWLLCEAADVLGDAELQAKVRDVALNMASAVLKSGVDRDGGIFYEGEPTGIVDSDKHWWPQAEGVVGFLNAYQLTHDEQYLNAAIKTWDFIEKYIIDKKDGEWFWSVSKDHKPSTDQPKVSEWKSPYHNCRACMEILTRIPKIESTLASEE